MTELAATGVARREQLSEQVAAYVREQILLGTVHTGEFLRMEPIAEALRVSNTPVREGLLTLRSEGLVRLIPRRGFVVAPFTRQDVVDLYWAQGRLAGELSSRAAQRITTDQFSRVEAAAAALVDAVQRVDRDGIGQAGHEFHRQVNLAAGSPRLALLLGSMANHLPKSFYARIEGQVASSRDDHAEIVEALRARDHRAARRLMQSHVMAAAGHVIDILE